MNLADILRLKFTDINFLRDVLLQDDGKGPYIKEWNLPEPKPDEATIAQWKLELEPAIEFLNNKASNTPIYDQLKAVDERSIRALRTNDVEMLAQLEQQAEALRAQLLPTS